MRALSLWVVALLCVSCHRSPLRCRTEYLYPTYLASERVNTPDPSRKCFYGQQVIVHWDLPKNCLQAPTELRLCLRFGNREIECVSTPITKACSYYVYQLVNRDYWCREGILSFKAELLQEGVVIGEWSHHLWSEIIEIQ